MIQKKRKNGMRTIDEIRSPRIQLIGTLFVNRRFLNDILIVSLAAKFDVYRKKEEHTI